MGAIPSAEGFDSRKMVEKEPVGVSALTRQSGGILSVEYTDTVLGVKKILSAED